MKTSAYPAAKQTDVLRGTFEEHALRDVLEIVSIGRQYVGVEVSSAQGESGVIYVKGGQVVSADALDLTGLPAFRSLFSARFEKFRVFRMTTPAALPIPLGSLPTLLLDVSTERPEALAPGPTAAPVEGGHPRRPSQQLTMAPPTLEPVEPKAQPASALEFDATAAHPIAVSAVAPMPKPTSATAYLPVPESSKSSRPPGSEVPVRSTLSSASAVVMAANSDNARHGHVLAVASPKGGAGKTTIALNLALSLARRGLRVVLIDGDVNGDILSSINARQRSVGGAYDALASGADPADLLLKTSLATLSILPAVGAALPDLALLSQDTSASWRSLFDRLLTNADLLVVDTPAGMFGATHSILTAASHVVGVLQAESVANRSFEMFARSLDAMAAAKRPAVAGVVLNMLQAAQSASLAVMQDAFNNLPGEWLFDVSIPRNSVFLTASYEGLPLGMLDEANPPAATYLFDLLASEVADRLQLTKPATRAPRAFLL